MHNQCKANGLPPSNIPLLVLRSMPDQHSGIRRYATPSNRVGIPRSTISAARNVTGPARNEAKADTPQPISSQFSDLGYTLGKVRDLFSRSAAVFDPHAVHYENPLKQFREEALSLRTELLAWSAMQPAETRARPMARFTRPYTLRFSGAPDLVCPAYRADTYYDCEFKWQDTTYALR
jgi:hypothetical protein